MHCEHEHDDGAYVLGALSPAERMAYERHLATCSFCREAVAEIAALPDLLARLDANEFAKLLDPTLSGHDPRSAGPHRHGTPVSPLRRKKAARVRLLSTAAAAVLAVVIGVGVVTFARGGGPSATPPGPAVAMSPVDASAPVSATIRLTSTVGGTKVDMLCSYSESAEGPNTFRLVAYGRDKQEDQLGSWQAMPGGDFPMQGFTHFTEGSLDRLVLVRYDGKIMLQYDVP